MSDMILKKADLKGFLEAVAKEYDLWAPKVVDGMADYLPWDGGEAPDGKVRTRNSIKKFIHPQKEVMFNYTTHAAKEDCNLLHEVMPEGKTAVFGVSSCDARSVVLNGLVFVNDPTNFAQCPYYDARWTNTVFIGLACNEPCAVCFCHATGGHPHGEEGLDIQLVDMGDEYLVKVLTEKGQAVAGLFDMKPAGDGIKAGAADKAKAALEAMPKDLKMGQAVGVDQMDVFDLPVWDDMAARCLNCGVCTFVCPTCYCFDIQDENKGTDGQRYRLWDSCMFPLYSYHASGHNPRPTKTERLRQRFMHKLNYFPTRHEDKLSCVGCGRCVLYCPVNIDIREVASRMKKDA